jgi:FixJ family two-component response regulator
MSSHAESSPVVFVLNSASATRRSLEALFRASGWRTEAYETAREFLRRPREFVPSCLVLDVVLADMCGLELQKQLAGSWPHLAIVFVAAGAETAAGVRAIKLGAVDFLTLPLEERQVLRATDEAIKRSDVALTRDAELRALGKSYASLSGREREVMALVTAGLMNKQVGDRLGISEITVKAHRGQVMRKMNARSFADLINKAAKLGPELRTSQASERFGSNTPRTVWRPQEDPAWRLVAAC